MLSFEEAGIVLDEAMEQLPEGIFDHLNGGVNLLRKTEVDDDGFLVLGKYRKSQMGRHIEIYYGSFKRMYQSASDAEWSDQLIYTLHHELTHHVEDLAGDKSLAKQDIIRKAARMNEKPIRKERKPEIKITDAHDEHIEQMAEIEQSCFSDPWPEEILRRSFTDGERHICLTAVENGRVLGYVFIMYFEDEGDISNIAVKAESRQKGIASKLMTAAIDRAVSLGIMTLGLEVRQSNVPAIELYKKFGFEYVGRRKNYYSFPKEDAILMTKTLAKKENRNR